MTVTISDDLSPLSCVCGRDQIGRKVQVWFCSWSCLCVPLQSESTYNNGKVIYSLTVAPSTNLTVTCRVTNNLGSDSKTINVSCKYWRALVHTNLQTNRSLIYLTPYYHTCMHTHCTPCHLKGSVKSSHYGLVSECEGAKIGQPWCMKMIRHKHHRSKRIIIE